MIDKISLKIMNELCHNGRASNTQIARKIGVSMITVAKKINAMMEEGVIEIKAMPNPNLLEYHHQALIGLSVDINKIESICRRLTKNIHVNMLTTTFGRFDIMLIVFFQELEMLHDYIKGELPGIEGINNIDSFFLLKDRTGKQDIFPNITVKNKDTLIDDLDRKLISELIRDGRPNHAALAKKLGVSKPTISRRIAVLLKESVIKIIAFPNPSKLGFMANAYVLAKAEYAKITNICDHLARYPEVHLVMKLVNDFDILFGVYSTDLDTLYEFLGNKIAKIKGIKKTETFMRGNFFYFSANALYAPPVENRS